MWLASILQHGLRRTQSQKKNPRVDCSWKSSPLTTSMSYPSISSPWQSLFPPALLVLCLVSLAATMPISEDYHSTFSHSVQEGKRKKVKYISWGLAGSLYFLFLILLCTTNSNLHLCSAAQQQFTAFISVSQQRWVSLSAFVPSSKWDH